MAIRVGIIGSSTAATTIPGWNDYEIQQFERTFLSSGVCKAVGSALEVTEKGAGANMSVDVAAGRALIEITNTNLTHGETYKVYFQNDATENIVINAADATLAREDRIIAKIDVATDPDASSANIGTVEVLTGTPSATPAPPALPANAISLATINVPAGATSIINANITDVRSYVNLSSSQIELFNSYTLTTDLASTANGKGASTIGIEDAAGNLTATNVEDAIPEILSQISSNLAVSTFGDNSDGALNVTTGTTTLDCANNNFAVFQYESFNVSSGATLTFNNTANDGTIVVFRVSGDCTIAGTVDGDGLGTLGGTGLTSVTMNGTDSGNTGTAPFNAISSLAGGVSTPVLSGTQVAAAGSGSPANYFNSGSSANDVVITPGTSTGGGGGSFSDHDSLHKLNPFGFVATPGMGGSSGSAVAGRCNINSAGSTIVGADGGRGGLTIIFIVGGNLTFTGTVTLQGESAGASTATAITTTGNQTVSVAIGGSSGGGAGSLYISVPVTSTVTDSGTKSLGGGSGGSGDSDTSSSGTGGGCAISHGGSAGATGSSGIYQLTYIL